MSNRKKILDLICSISASLPPNQKRVADFFSENIELVALLSVKDVSKQAGVSEASIVRFAQFIGYNGYKELKSEISTALKGQLSPTEHYQHAISEKEKAPDILKLVAQNVINNINETIKSIDHDVFSEAVESIIKARRIYCLGLEVSHQFSQLMTFLLCVYGYDARTLSLDFLQYHEQIAHFSSDDLLIAFSFSPYSRDTVEAVAHAKKRGISSIAFTDKKTAPIRDYASYYFQVKTDNIMFTNSLGAVAVVINAIITELNFKDKERTLRSLKIIEENIKDERYFITK